MKNASNLCYWYGGYTDPSHAYSFLNTSKLISYDTGVKKGYDKLPKGIQKKLDEKKKLSSTQEQLVRGLTEMNEDAKLAPKERIGYMPKVFLEVYEVSCKPSEGVLPTPKHKKTIAPDKSTKKEKKARDQQAEVADIPVKKKGYKKREMQEVAAKTAKKADAKGKKKAAQAVATKPEEVAPEHAKSPSKKSKKTMTPKELKMAPVKKAAKTKTKIEEKPAKAEPKKAPSESPAATKAVTPSAAGTPPAPSIGYTQASKKSNAKPVSKEPKMAPVKKAAKTKSKFEKKPAKAALKKAPNQSPAGTHQAPRQQKSPLWLTEVSNAETPSDEKRSFALDFLQEVALIIPSSKNINHDSIARALEAAIYEWASKDGTCGKDWRERYWDKVHDVIWNINGTSRHGSIATMIAEGKFQTPGQIVAFVRK